MRRLAGVIVAASLGLGTAPAVQAQIREDIERALRGEVVRHDLDVRMAGDAIITIDFMLVLGICLPWIAGVEPAKMADTLEARGLKANWVGTRLAGFDLPRRPEFLYSGISLGEGGAWCEVHLSYAKTQVSAVAAEIDAVAGRIPPYFRLTPIPPVKDQNGNLSARAWAAPGATMTFNERPTAFPGSTARDATLYLEKKP